MIENVYTFNSIDESILSGFILRHDVDFDVKKAYDLSKIEKNNNIKSTYFFLVSSDMYNVMTVDNKSMIKEMIDEGFEIGLHFDPTVYMCNDEELNEKVKLESSILEDITKQRVQAISLHNPSVHGKYPEFEGYKNAYSNNYFNDEIYISDSGRSFRGKDPFEFIQNGKSKLIQVLLHPIHFSYVDEKYIPTFARIFADKIKQFDRKMTIHKVYSDECINDNLFDLVCKHRDDCFNEYRPK